MTWFRLSKGGADTPAKLDPPPTAAEIEWWTRAQRTFRRREVVRTTLLVQLPLFAGLAYMRGWAFVASWGGLRMTAGFVVIVAIGGAASWRVQRNARFRQELIAKRLREAILAPHDDPPDALLRADVSLPPRDE